MDEVELVTRNQVSNNRMCVFIFTKLTFPFIAYDCKSLLNEKERQRYRVAQNIKYNLIISRIRKNLIYSHNGCRNLLKMDIGGFYDEEKNFL